MKDQTNEQNLKADEITYGNWASGNELFADEKPIKLLYEMFMAAKPELPETISIAEFGSAEGLVGEYFARQLKEDGYNTSLTLVDAIKEHLDVNVNPETSKLNKNLLDISFANEFDLGILRSVFHYFSKESQDLVASNIFRAIKPGGYFVSQNFVQYTDSLDLYLEFNHAIGKVFQLEQESEIVSMFERVGFKEVIHLGDLPTWHFAANKLQNRYKLTTEAIMHMREKIVNTPEEKRVGFEVTEDGFTVPIPYKVFLMRKI